jgi:hypothetical protein
MKVPMLIVLAFVPAMAFPWGWVSSGRAAAADEDLAGTYECQGTMASGRNYRGTVHIVRTNGTYQVLWTLSERERYLGIGLFTDNVLAVSYFTGTPGVVVYHVEPGDKGPRLVGRWTAPGAGGRVFVETLTRLTKEVTMPVTPKEAPSPRSRIVLPWFALRAT